MPKDSPVGFNQFLIDDEQPALIHTGMAPMYADVCKAIGQVLDPSRLAYIILLHFEGDECGGMERFMAQAPHARLVGCELSASLNLNSFDFACQGRVTGKRDGEAMSLGRHTLRFLETPHVHHWDSMMLWEETTSSLFPADLFIQPGDQPPVIRENISSAMCELYRHAGIFAHGIPSAAWSIAWNELSPSGFTPCTEERSPARSSRASPKHSANSPSRIAANCSGVP
jgi:flavorubredoxin